ncbi:FtsX-like permease family protein [Anseongella ginsenosidimutans]|nr:FtsX-like permease family protein [Anseongella ginsenosidimutans]
MLRNYFKIALRNLWKHRVFSFINITGLAVGMTACFLIFLYVSFESSYDSFHQKGDRIYRLVSDLKIPTGRNSFGTVPWPVGPAIKNDFPEVESFVRMLSEDLVLTKGNVKFEEANVLYADSAFFQVFDFKLLNGNFRTALKDPFSIVLSRRAAKKYFGNEDPLGQTLTLPRNDTVLTASVTGIMENMPENSQIQADILVSASTLTQFLFPWLDEQWGGIGCSTYLLLKPGANAGALKAKFPAFLDRKAGEQAEARQSERSLQLEPLKEVYLHSRYAGPGMEMGNIQNIRIFSLVAVLIMLIACFNFINLTTARAAERAREVGVRKAVGAVKKHLVLQFIVESVLLCLMAFVLTLILSMLLIPAFNHLAGKTITPGLFASGGVILIVFLAAIGVGLLAGLYPALVLSSFRPVGVLKGRFVANTKGILFRKGMVVAQFTISLMLIIATIVVYRQLHYMRSQDLGFRKDQMMVIKTYSNPAIEAFNQSIERLSGVNSTTFSSSAPGDRNPRANSEIENTQGDLQPLDLDAYFVDFDYMHQYEMEMAAGRPFSRNFGTDSAQALILNEAAVRLLGYTSPEQIIGKRFRQWDKNGKVIGVVKDFHVRSLQDKITPLSIGIDPTLNRFLLSVDVRGANLSATITAIEKEWQKFIPDYPFSYEFLDAAFDQQYRSEERFGNIFSYFTMLAIFISCLGLLGLASYTALQRTKEIGIRKVMGASVASILALLSRDFVKLIAISILIAVPVAWYAMSNWLEGFAYRVNVEWWVLSLASLLLILIALLTISFQSVKAALMNPLKSLKSE